MVIFAHLVDVGVPDFWEKSDRGWVVGVVGGELQVGLVDFCVKLIKQLTNKNKLRRSISTISIPHTIVTSFAH